MSMFEPNPALEPEDDDGPVTARVKRLLRDNRAVADIEANEAPWYLATCTVCEPRLPQPFRSRVDRAEWALAHEAGTGHPVIREEQT